MKDFTKAQEAAQEVARAAGSVETYLEDVKRVLKAADEAVGAAVAMDRGDGEMGYWVPDNEWRGLRDAYERAW